MTSIDWFSEPSTLLGCYPEIFTAIPNRSSFGRFNPTLPWLQSTILSCVSLAMIVTSSKFKHGKTSKDRCSYPSYVRLAGLAARLLTNRESRAYLDWKILPKSPPVLIIRYKVYCSEDRISIPCGVELSNLRMYTLCTSAWPATRTSYLSRLTAIAVITIISI